MPPFEIQIFSPSRRIVSLPTGVAASWISATSEPASGSVSAKAAMVEPSRTPGKMRRLISSEAASVIEPEPRPCMAKAKSASPSNRASVSRMMHSERTSKMPLSGAA